MRWTPIVGQLEPSPNSPLTKSGFIDSVWTGDCRICRHGDGARGQSARRSDRDLGRDASLAGTCVLRPASGSPDRGRFRAVCRDGMPALLRAEDGRTVSAAGALFPDAHGWLFRGNCQRAGHRVAVFGFDVAARFSAAGEPGEGSRSFVVVEDPRAASP